MKTKILAIICLISSILFIIQIIINFADKKESVNFYNSITPSNNVINLDELETNYPSIKGYIEIKGTNINYPIVQGQNNEYYLNHLPNGKENKMGSIYLDYRNNEFNDDNSIIYGHNTEDNTMFSALENYQNQSFYEEHKYYNLYNKNSVINVEIFAVYIANATKEILPINFNNQAEKKEYLNTINKKNILNNKIDISTNNKLITLCTCSDIYGSDRLIIVGKIINIKNQ